MKTMLIIIVCKFIIFLGKLVHRGSVKAGAVALKLDKKIISKLSKPKKIIAVTGSSGKGSTTKLIAEVLRNNGVKVVHNASGSNLRNGILTTLLENCAITGKVKYDVFVMEIDERWTKIIFPELKPDFVVITNLTRDQPPRQGNVDIVFSDIKKALTSDMHLILNGDDPYLQKFVDEEFKNISYFGISKNKYVYKKSKFDNLNIYYCPNCNSKLNYEFYHFETLGCYKCTNCNFKRPDIDFLATEIEYDKGQVIINDDHLITLNMPVLFSIYNILAAFSVLSLYGIDKDIISKHISTITGDKKIFNHHIISKRNIYIFNNKNENSTTFNQSLLFIDRYKNKKTIIIGWKEISRRYKYNDVSWLYDVDFEILAKHDIEKIICVGRDCYDIATRIKLSGISQNKIQVFKDLNESVKYLKNNTKSDVYAILNFDYIEPFNTLIKEDKQ